MLRLPYYVHYINSAKPYLSRHVKVIYWFKEMEVALPPFFRKNIVVVLYGCCIYGCRTTAGSPNGEGGLCL